MDAREFRSCYGPVVRSAFESIDGNEEKHTCHIISLINKKYINKYIDFVNIGTNNELIKIIKYSNYTRIIKKIMVIKQKHKNNLVTKQIIKIKVES